MNITVLLQEMAQHDASDLHLKVGRKPFYRVKKDLIEVVHHDVLTDEDVESFAFSMMNPLQQKVFLERHELDLAYESEEVGRFRVNIFKQRGHFGIVLRRIKKIIPSFEELGLPPVLSTIASSQDGLVLIAGPTGCGKSTTMAAIINYVNANARKHIITIEDPIEFLYTDDKSLINQREVEIDTLSFHAALKHVLREDPDIILIGELRDTDTFEAAIKACETGHLVYGTLHTVDTLTTIRRILDFFPQEEHPQVRKTLAYNLRSTVCQKLVPTKDGNGLVPVCEIMLVTPIISKLIIEDKINKIPAAMTSDKQYGMQTFNQHLVKLIEGDIIDREAGFVVSPAPDALEMNLRGIYLDEDTRIIGE
ncbi:MAG: PilT/PilU family type 4a pilus ATPase [Candidatus Ratteibacteria bacterium]